MTEGVAPPGWPPAVRPPGVPDWERTAVTWLLDQCPPDYRAHDVLRRHPVVLARFASVHLHAGVQAARELIATLRTGLGDVVAPETVEAALAAAEREGARLSADARGAALVEAALRGRRFAARL